MPSSILILLAQTATQSSVEAAYRLTPGGWVIMIFSVGVMTGLLGWCIYKVVGTPGSTEHLHAQSDIEPPDRD